MDGTLTCTIVPRRSTKQTYLPSRYRDYVLMDNVMTVIELLNFEQAKDKKEWVNAMNEEENSIMKNKTWELTEFPENKSPIGCKWLFKSKFKADGSNDKYKTRLVGKVHAQRDIFPSS